MPRDDAAIVDIIRAVRLMLSFVRGIDKDTFLRDEKTQSAVPHQLLVLGEAVKRISNDFRVAHPDVPWKLMAGMRDKIIHEYDAVDLDEVWKTIDSDIPKLVPVLEPLEPAEK